MDGQDNYERFFFLFVCVCVCVCFLGGAGIICDVVVDHLLMRPLSCGFDIQDVWGSMGITREGS